MDFCDGTVVCALVENLQKRTIKPWTRNPGNQHLFLENATTALKSIEEDGVKLVNIGEIIYFQ
jgi:filamin